MKKRLKESIDALLREKELFTNSGIIFGAGLIGSLLMFISNIVLSRQFGPTLFGNYRTVISLFLFLPMLIEFGADKTLTKYIAELYKTNESNKISYLIRWFLKLRITTYILSATLIFMFRNQITAYFLKDTSLIYLIIPGIILSTSIFFEVFKAIILGFQKFRLYAFSNFATSASIGLLTLFFGYFFNVYYAIIGWGLGYVIGNICNIGFILKEKTITKLDKKMNMLKIIREYTFPMYLLIIPGFLGFASVPILSIFFPQTLIGYYAFAGTFYMGITLIQAAFSQVLFPRVSELNSMKEFHTARSALKKILSVYLLISIIGTLAVLSLSKSMISIIAPEYLPGLFVFKAVLIFGFLSGNLLIYGSYLNGLGKVKKLALVTTIYHSLLLLVAGISLKITGGV